MTKKSPLDDLVNGADIARRLGISNQRVHQLADRDQTFPAPLGKMGRSTVWRWGDVEKWAIKTGRVSADDSS